MQTNPNLEMIPLEIKKQIWKMYGGKDQFMIKYSSADDRNQYYNNYMSETTDPTIEQIKFRIKSKVLKHWGKKLEEIIKEPEDRSILYNNAFVLRTDESKPLPNSILLKFLIEKLGHWDEEHHKGVKDDKHPKIPKQMDDKLIESFA